LSASVIDEILHEVADGGGASSLIELAQEVGIQLAERDLAGLADTAARCFAVANERRDVADATWAATEVLAQLVVAHNRQVRAQQENVDFEALSESQQEMIAAMAEGPVMPGAYARETELQPARVSRLLRDLKLAGLCRPAKHSGDQRKRPHELTPLGHEVAERLGERPPFFAFHEQSIAWDRRPVIEFMQSSTYLRSASQKAVHLPIDDVAALISHPMPAGSANAHRVRAKRVSSNGTRPSRANAPV